MGLSRILEGDDGTTLTGTRMGVGTPEYMAPEQAQGKTPDGRADVYALGVVLYELITGRKPYTADTPMAVVLKQAMAPLPRPGEFVSDLPQEVEQVLYKALAKDPENRYESMETFATAMEKLLWLPAESQTGSRIEKKQPIQTAPRSVPAPTASNPEVTRDDLLLGDVKQEKVKPQKSSVRKPIKKPSLPWWAWVGGISGLVVLVILASFLLGGGESGGLAFLTSETPTLTQTPVPTSTKTATLTFIPSATSTQTRTSTLTATLTLIPSATRYTDTNTYADCNLGSDPGDWFYPGIREGRDGAGVCAGRGV